MPDGLAAARRCWPPAWRGQELRPLRVGRGPRHPHLLAHAVDIEDLVVGLPDPPEPSTLTSRYRPPIRFKCTSWGTRVSAVRRRLEQKLIMSLRQIPNEGRGWPRPPWTEKASGLLIGKRGRPYSHQVVSGVELSASLWSMVVRGAGVDSPECITFPAYAMIVDSGSDIWTSGWCKPRCLEGPTPLRP